MEAAGGNIVITASDVHIRKLGDAGAAPTSLFGLSEAVQGIQAQLAETIRKIVQEEIATSIQAVRQDLSTQINELVEQLGSAAKDVAELKAADEAAAKCAEVGLLQGEGVECIPPAVSDASGAPRGRSCAELKENGVDEDGTYTLVGSDGNVVETYCDMTTDGGGWTEIAYVADEFDWVCPGHSGADCRAASTPTSDANLFAATHTKSALKPLLPDKGKNSGAHLPMAAARSLFADGDLAEVRWTFLDGPDPSATVLNDVTAVFATTPAELFKEDAHAHYLAGTDFTLKVLKKEAAAKVDANIICWGDNAGELYRSYEQGLHMGVAATGTEAECHLQNDKAQVQFKSHYTRGDAWYEPASGDMYSFLDSRLQRGSSAIRIFVRSQPREKHAWGSPANPGASCDDLKRHGVSKSGTYWITANGKTLEVDCDMETAAGGWTLVAKVASDFEWACPDKLGASCADSPSDPSLANLFDERHARPGVARPGGGGEDSGVHLDNDVIRSLFLDGQPADLRFTFADAAWRPINDGYVTFDSLPAELFRDNAHGQYRAGRNDYKLTVLKQASGAAWAGDTLCWTGPMFPGNFRNYEGGLHFGKATDKYQTCHLTNDNNEVQLKSHLATGGVDSTAQWYPDQHGMLRKNALQFPSDRIAIWVRSAHRDATKLGSAARPATSCNELYARGVRVSGMYHLRTSTGRVFPAECDMETADGGWTLVAKVTRDFEWICPEQEEGADCVKSIVPYERANLFDDSHTQPSVGLTDADHELSGVHLPLADIRDIFEVKRSVRFAFYDDKFETKSDLYTSFGAATGTALFRDGESGFYRKGRDYTLTIIKAEKQVRADQVCWSSSTRTSERAGYEEGLHMGGSSQDYTPCHLDNDPSQVQLKSHLTTSDGKGWFTNQIPFLRQDNYKAASSAIGIWVR